MQQFSIKDLETFTGIKAHTIRIWEQRYNLLEPQRTSNNIRYYTVNDLKHLLNVGILIDNGFKISFIAEMSETEMTTIISKLNTEDTKEQHFLNLLKISMLNYDEALFCSVVDAYLADHTVDRIFERLFMPFMHQVGILWLTSVICPAQEHFISNLLRQKLFSWIDQSPIAVEDTKPLLVMFLPQGEIHEISLLLFHYMARQKGHRSIFLGQSVPFEDLLQISQKYPHAQFVSYSTTAPSAKNAQQYVDRIHREFSSSQVKFHLGGKMLQDVSIPTDSCVKIYASGGQLAETIFA
jgi:DNA-binding transcriptional MerR regulator